MDFKRGHSPKICVNKMVILTLWNRLTLCDGRSSETMVLTVYSKHDFVTAESHDREYVVSLQMRIFIL